MLNVPGLKRSFLIHCKMATPILGMVPIIQSIPRGQGCRGPNAIGVGVTGEREKERSCQRALDRFAMSKATAVNAMAIPALPGLRFGRAPCACMAVFFVDWWDV